MKPPKVSVIVPIYNQEKYLERSLASLVNQQFLDFEVLMIDDGSTDTSAEICKRFQAQDSRFRYFWKPNGGVASSRQYGIERVQGRYTIHMDPDDWVEPDYLSKLYEKAIATGADMVICDYVEEYIDKSKIVNAGRDCSVKDYKLQLCRGEVWGICWNKLIRTDCFHDRVVFETGINFHEDKLFIYRVLQNCIALAFISTPIYHYNRTNADSAVNNQSKATIMQTWLVRKLIVEAERDFTIKELVSDAVIPKWSAHTAWGHPLITQQEYLNMIYPFRRAIKRKSGTISYRIIRFISLYSRTNFLKTLYVRYCQRHSSQ